MKLRQWVDLLNKKSFIPAQIIQPLNIIQPLSDSDSDVDLEQDFAYKPGSGSKITDVHVLLAFVENQKKTNAWPDLVLNWYKLSQASEILANFLISMRIVSIFYIFNHIITLRTASNPK